MRKSSLASERVVLAGEAICSCREVIRVTLDSIILMPYNKVCDICKRLRSSQTFICTANLNILDDLLRGFSTGQEGREQKYGCENNMDAKQSLVVSQNLDIQQDVNGVLARIGKEQWRGFNRFSGVAAFAVVGLWIALMAGMIAWGVPPATVEEWFVVLESNPLLAVFYMDPIDLMAFALLIPVYLALYHTLRENRPALVTFAAVLVFIGIGVCFATVGSYWSLMSLSEGYTIATTEAQRAVFLAAGQAVIVIAENGFVLGRIMSVGGLLFAVAMIRNPAFGKAPAIIGILAMGIDILGIFNDMFTGISGTFWVIWFLWIGLTLYRRVGSDMK